jgi:flagellin
MLQRVRDLKVQFSNDTLSDEDRGAISAEVYEIAKEVKSITDDTEFNGKSLFSASATTFTFQVGANDGETITTGSAQLTGSAGAGGLSELVNIGSAGAASAAMSTGGFAALSSIDTAIANVSKIRGNLGAVQNRLEHRLANLATYQENLTASESRIRDVDMASEMTKFTKLNILQQAGTSMLAQANQGPQGVLSLLR